MSEELTPTPESVEPVVTPPIDKDNPFKWGHYKFVPREWTLNAYLENLEAVANNTTNGFDFRSMFKGQCKALLKGVDPESQVFLGNLASVALSATEKADQIQAMRLRGVIDFLTSAYENTAMGLVASAPDLAPVIQEAKAKAKAKAQVSPTDTKPEPVS
jgi:hypothetical protein